MKIFNLADTVISISGQGQVNKQIVIEPNSCVSEIPVAKDVLDSIDSLFAIYGEKIKVMFTDSEVTKNYNKLKSLPTLAILKESEVTKVDEESETTIKDQFGNLYELDTTAHGQTCGDSCNETHDDHEERIKVLERDLQKEIADRKQAITTLQGTITGLRNDFNTYKSATDAKIQQLESRLNALG